VDIYAFTNHQHVSLSKVSISVTEKPPSEFSLIGHSWRTMVRQARAFAAERGTDFGQGALPNVG
jgi:hypothetical protein